MQRASKHLIGRAQGMLQVTRTGLSGHIVTPHTAQVDAHSIVV